MRERIKNFLDAATSYWWIWLLVTLLLARGIRAAETGGPWFDVKPAMTPLTQADILHLTAETLEPMRLESTPSPAPPQSEDIVYITENGSAYHTDPTCSRMKEPCSVTKEEAEQMKRKPCSRCVPDEE